MALGGVGFSAEAPAVPSDLEAIYQGGQFFLDRMKVMADQREAAAKALTDLQLGNDIVGAKTAAEKALVAADGAEAAARLKLVNAETAAVKIIADAKEQADKLADEAMKANAKVMAALKAAREEADIYAASSRQAADAMLANATAQHAAITGQMNAARKAEDDFVAAKSKQEDATKSAEAMLQLYRQKIAQLQAVIAQTNSIE